MINIEHWTVIMVIIGSGFCTITGVTFLLFMFSMVAQLWLEQIGTLDEIIGYGMNRKQYEIWKDECKGKAEEELRKRNDADRTAK